MKRSKIFTTATTLALAGALLATSGPTFARDREERRYERDHHRSAQTERRRGHEDRGDRRREHPARQDRADRFDRRVDRRQDRQHARIHHGLRSGELNRHEAHRLRKQQRRIDRMERRFSADGRLTRPERRRLTRALDRASERIHRYKHNDRYRHRDLYERPHRYSYRYDRGHNGGLWYFDRF